MLCFLEDVVTLAFWAASPAVTESLLRGRDELGDSVAWVGRLLWKLPALYLITLMERQSLNPHKG